MFSSNDALIDVSNEYGLLESREEPYMARNVNAPRTNAAALLLCCYAVSRWPDF
jgi:hypothetical protein